jgi:hypothetical protein
MNSGQRDVSNDEISELMEKLYIVVDCMWIPQVS